MELELKREKMYVNGTLKALKISGNNMYKLAKVFSKNRNIPENISDTISEVTIIEKDNSEGSECVGEYVGGDYTDSNEHVGGSENSECVGGNYTDSSEYVGGSENNYIDYNNSGLDNKPKTVFKKCVFCSDIGHWAKNCDLIPVEYNQHCFRCWMLGHFTSNCVYQSEVKPPWMTEEEFTIFRSNKKKGILFLFICTRFFKLIINII